MKKIFFTLLFCLCICFGNEELDNTNFKKKKLKEFTDISFVFGKMVNNQYDYDYFYLPDDFYKTTSDFEFNFSKAVFLNGIFHFLYKSFNLYGENLANNDFGIGIDISLHRVGVSTGENQNGSFDKLKLGLATDINHVVFLAPIAFFSYTFFPYNLPSRKFLGPVIAIAGLTSIIVSPFLAYIPLMINHYLQPFGFYFHSVAGISMDFFSLFEEEEKNYNSFLGYFGIKVAWKFLQAKKFSVVLKTGIIGYFNNTENFYKLFVFSLPLRKTKESYYSIPLELGISF